MKINIYPIPSLIAGKNLANTTVIVVDVLRATTSILQALLGGARYVIPARSVEEARALSLNWDKTECVLAGEIGGLKIPGYQIGNSPFEFTSSLLKGRVVVMCTTNGTGAIHTAINAKDLFLGCLRNKTAVARAALRTGNDIIILCAGTKNECSADDVICAGAIARSMYDLMEEQPEFNDFALISSMLYGAWKQGSLALDAIGHCRDLIELGFQEDLAFCFQEDQSEDLMVYKNGSIYLEK